MVPHLLLSVVHDILCGHMHGTCSSRSACVAIRMRCGMALIKSSQQLHKLRVMPHLI